MRAALFALALMLALAPFDNAQGKPLTPQAVANRCAGEAANGVQICSCVFRSRLLNGWDPSLVRNAFFAKDRPASPEQVKQAEDGLAGVGCVGTEYYLFSKADIRYLGLRVDCAVATSGGVWAFARDALKACRVN